jgi:hypothetical protein
METWMLKFLLESAFWMAVFAGLAVFGRWLVKHSRAPNGGDDAPHVPAACVVTTERTYRFPVASPPVAWGRIIGHILVVIGVGACVLLALTVVLMVTVGPG